MLLKKVGINTWTELDGEYHLPLGGGVIGTDVSGDRNSTSGRSQNAEKKKLTDQHWYSAAQEIIIRELQKALAVNPIKEKTSLDCIQLKMSELENDRITVKCQEYGTKVVLFFDKQKKFTSLSGQPSYNEGSFFKVFN